eukprot:2270692-Rhodomonas_salina.1
MLLESALLVRGAGIRCAAVGVACFYFCNRNVHGAARRRLFISASQWSAFGTHMYCTCGWLGFLPADSAAVHTAPSVHPPPGFSRPSKLNSRLLSDESPTRLRQPEHNNLQP